jgi:signal transduction histidine kinase
VKSYPQTWGLTVGLLSVASLVPVIVIAVLDYQFTRRALHREHELQVERLASNARRTVAHFLEERLEALSFAAHGLGRQGLTDSRELEVLLENLKADFGGFTDLGVIDETGRQVGYCGPFDLEGRNYGDQEWFGKCRERGAFVGDVQRGYRGIPHVVVAVRATPPDGPFRVLRATLDLERLREILVPYAPGDNDDIFLVNRSGVIQTPSLRYGDVLGSSPIEVPPASPHTEVLRIGGDRREPVTMGYAYVSTNHADTPFVLLLIRGGSSVGRVSSWLLTSRIVFVACTIVGIVLVVAVTSSYMFNRLYDADGEKARAISHMEDVNRLASLGRLAAGVAHEINNPLAVIKESAGYIQDLLTLQEGGAPEDELEEQTQAIVDSVNRCGGITGQLLSFARGPDLRPGPVDLHAVIKDVLAFHEREAEFRNISIGVEIEEDVREIDSDRGKLREIFLNLVMNAFDAMPEGGDLRISARRCGLEEVSIEISDTGIGMSEEVQKSVFEPFFTTKSEGEGTGLGLSITYGLVRRLGGRIAVKSEVGKGAVFRIVLPTILREEASP